MFLIAKLVKFVKSYTSYRTIDNEKAEVLKNEGNTFFKLNEFRKALDLYSRAIELSDGIPRSFLPI